MYIVTFCSFRGGVGRTTALVNAGLELARRGRNVLLVDFDLESPDLLNFPPIEPNVRTPGLLDYVVAYRDNGYAPDVKDYLFEVNAGEENRGRLLVLAAGLGNAEYWQTLAGLDWQALYDHQEGYEFFKDTRLQWQQLGVDYVLIDTHAGMTSSLGIPMRQLPDAVVMVINPNRPGREGLTEAGWQIREEPEQTGRKPIELLPVLVGVVEADETPPICYETESVLFDDFVATLPFSPRLISRPAVPGEPQGALAREYGQLANALIAANFSQDSDGARVLLCDIHAGPTKAAETFDSSGGVQCYHAKLDQILDSFPNDADIQAQAACCLYAAGRYDRALEALGRAIELRPSSPELLWQRASYRERLGDVRGASADLLLLLDQCPVPPPVRQANLTPARIAEIREKIRVARATGTGKVQVSRPRFSLPEEFGNGKRPPSLPDYSEPLLALTGVNPYVVSAFRRLRQLDGGKYEEAKNKPCFTGLPVELQKHLLSDRLPDHEEADLRGLVRSKNWGTLMTLLQPRLDESDCCTLADAIYLFIAWWGLDNEEAMRKYGEKAIARFDQLLNISKPLNPSDLAMMSLVFWKTGDRAMADSLLDYLEEDSAWETAEPLFSFWRCERVSCHLFKEDCHLQRQLYKEGATFFPPFLGKGERSRPTTSDRK